MTTRTVSLDRSSSCFSWWRVGWVFYVLVIPVLATLPIFGTYPVFSHNSRGRETEDLSCRSNRWRRSASAGSSPPSLSRKFVRLSAGGRWIRTIGPAREKLHSGGMWFPRTAPLASRPRGNSQLQTADIFNLQPYLISRLFCGRSVPSVWAVNGNIPLLG